VTAFTLRYRTAPSEADLSALDALARRSGGRATWQRNADPLPSYALVEDVDETFREALPARVRADVLDSPIIAVAVFPRPAEALRALEDALGCAGGPEGIISCERANDTLILEWNLDRTAAVTILAVIDVELARFGGGRHTRLLSPIPLRWWTLIAAEGLDAPEIAPDRVLEALLEAHDVVH
jgi:hypothetical protein